MGKIKLEITGPNLIQSALDSPFVQIDSIVTNKYFANELDLRRYKNEFSLKILSQEGKGREKISAKVVYEPYTQFDEAFFEKAKTLLYLDHLSDPQNLGNALRHAQAFEVDAVLLPVHKACPITETVARASVGALFQIPVFHLTSVGSFLSQLKKEGFGLIGTALEGAVSFSPDLFWDKSIIAIGSEGGGLRPSTIKASDSLVKIDHHQSIQSLNAATTATLICYERFKQLNAKK